MKIRILDEAQQDLIDGFRFYENQQVGLGGCFLDTLFSDIDSLQLFAATHPSHFGYYRLLAKRFPFAVYYRVDQQTVLIYAVAEALPGRGSACRNRTGHFELMQI